MVDNSKNSAKDILDSFETLGNEEKIELLSSLILRLKGKSTKDVPISIFDNDKLSIFESVAKYMHENLKLKFVMIAALLNRSDKTIWTTYNKSKKKMPELFSSAASDINIPIEKFSDRAFTIFECVVAYLKDHGLANHEIAVKLHRDDRTIWSVYDRVKKKAKK